jgi:hypothetical protein
LAKKKKGGRGMRFYCAIIFFLCCFFITVLAHAEVRGTAPTQTIEDLILSYNPPCKEGHKIWQLQYDKLRLGDKVNCKRYRPWRCADTSELGVDIEQLPLSFCEKDDN